MGQNKEVILSIDIGGSKLIAGVIGYDGSILYMDRHPLNPSIREVDIINEIMLSIEKIKNTYPLSCISACGITIPGLADAKRGIWVYACFSGIRNFKIAEILSQKLKIPVFIENDVNACAFGEKLFGVCKYTNNFIWVTVSNGVGGGIVLNGDIYTGAFGNAGEIGHFNVVEEGYQCHCGNNGCLEAYAAGPAIVRRYYESLGIYDKSLWRLSAKDIASQAKDGDVLSSEVYKKTGYYLGKAIAGAVNIVNPEKVILGGGISMDIELFYDEMKSTFLKNVFRDANDKVKIVKTGLGYEAALIGAAAAAIKGMKG